MRALARKILEVAGSDGLIFERGDTDGGGRGDFTVTAYFCQRNEKRALPSKLFSMYSFPIYRKSLPGLRKINIHHQGKNCHKI